MLLFHALHEKIYEMREEGGGGLLDQDFPTTLFFTSREGWGGGVKMRLYHALPQKYYLVSREGAGK